MPLGFAAVAVLAHNQAPYSDLPLWVLIILAVILGASSGFLLSFLSVRFISWLLPTQPSPAKLRLTLTSILILALLGTWMTWRDVPTNAQIDAIHNDPRFAAAIAEVNEKHINAHLLAAAMKNGHAQVNRYAVFAIETSSTFVGLLFLFVAYRVIFRILAYAFRFKDGATDIAAD